MFFFTEDELCISSGFTVGDVDSISDRYTAMRGHHRGFTSRLEAGRKPVWVKHFKDKLSSCHCCGHSQCLNRVTSHGLSLELQSFQSEDSHRSIFHQSVTLMSANFFHYLQYRHHHQHLVSFQLCNVTSRLAAKITISHRINNVAASVYQVLRENGKK